MSVIAVKKYDDRIVLAADSIMMSGDNRENERLNYSKIFEENSMVIACAGSAQDCLLLKSFSRNHKPLRSDTDAVFEFMVDFLKWAKEKIDTYELEMCSILVYEGKMFATTDLEVYEINDFYADGAGRDFALTALHLGFGPEQAVETACQMSMACSLPVVSFTV